MFRTVEINNFLSHKHTVIEFCDGFNCIVGHSDSGKSAMLQALGWLIENRPTGEGFRSLWGGETSVILTTDDEYTIKRIRDKNVNRYELYHPSFSKPLILEAFVTAVPAEVVQALNLTDVNIQRQLDTHFLLWDTPGEAAQYFNKVARLDKITTAEANIKSWIANIQSNIKKKEDDIAANTEKLKAFDHLPALEAGVKRLELLMGQRDNITTRRHQLSVLIDDYTITKDELQAYQHTANAETLVNDLLKQSQRREALAARADNIEALVNEIVTIRAELTECKAVIKAESTVNHLIKLNDERQSILTKKNVLQTLIQQVETLTQETEQATKTYNALHTQFEREFPDVCPLCGSKIEKKQ